MYLHMEKLQTPIKTKRRQLLRRLALWTLLWVVTQAIVVFGYRELWNEIRWITALVLAVNVILGLGMVWTYRNLMDLFDELERKIQLESMALTLGLTLVAGLGYTVMDITNLIPWDAEIGNLVFFMGVCYITCILVNTRRYA